jgi:Rrf2 family protein
MPIITRETDYALRALARLADGNEFLPVSALAEEADAPEGFLRKIMQTLHRAELVESRQGPFGGYRLAVPPDQVSLLEVMEVVQGEFAVNECFRSPSVCERSPDCPVRGQLRRLQRSIAREFAGVTLADMRQQAATEESTS